jgi:hypothetical protein
MNEPCARSSCTCTHTYPCEQGWIYVTETIKQTRTLRDGTKKEIVTVYDSCTFCPTCDPERAQITNSATTVKQRDEQLRSRSHFKTAENYDKQEQSRTRTL